MKIVYHLRASESKVYFEGNNSTAAICDSDCDTEVINATTAAGEINTTMQPSTTAIDDETGFDTMFYVYVFLGMLTNQWFGLNAKYLSVYILILINEC